MLCDEQACSRAEPSHDSYFGGAVGGREYSTGMCVGYGPNNSSVLTHVNVSCCGLLLLLMVLLFVVASRKAPKWLKRPVGATFGFGGKLVSFAPKKAAAGAAAAVSEVWNGDNVLLKDHAEPGGFMFMK